MPTWNNGWHDSWNDNRRDGYCQYRYDDSYAARNGLRLPARRRGEDGRRHLCR